MIMKDWMTSTEGMCHTISLPTKLIEVLSLHCFRGISGKKFLDPKNSSNIDLHTNLFNLKVCSDIISQQVHH